MVRDVGGSRPKVWPDSMVPWMRCVSGVLLASVVLGCGQADDGREARAPGEVPWLGSCADDTDCAEGQCLCGTCSAPCVDGACGADGPPRGQCLEPGHWLSEALCAGRSAGPMCLSGCDATSPCEAGFECLDGFCVASSAAAIARERELIPIAPLCERDRVVWRSLFIESAEQAEALRGCERVEGNLRIDAHGVSDLSSLAALREVVGELEISARSPFARGDRPLVHPVSLQSLERVAKLTLFNVSVDALSLGALRAIEGAADSGLYFDSVGGLTTLAGLANLERVAHLELSNIPDLTSLQGLASLRSVVDLDVYRVPLVELGLPAALELTGYLSFVETSLRTLQGMGDASRPSSVWLGGNADLVSLEGLRVPESLGDLKLENNPRLEDLSALRGLREVLGGVAIAGSPLVAATGLDELERATTVSLFGLGVVATAGLGRLSSADGLILADNEALVTLAGLAPAASIGDMAVSNNPSLERLDLDGVRVGRLSVRASPGLQSSGLGTATFDSLELEELPGMVSLAGLRPSRPERIDVSLRQCPALSDLGALAGLSSLDSLLLTQTGIVDLAPLASVRSLGALSLVENPNLIQIDALAQIAALDWLRVSQNPALVALPSFDRVLFPIDPGVCLAECGSAGEACAAPCGPELTVSENAALERGPGFAQLSRAARVQIDANPNLVSTGSFAALRSVFHLQVEGNPLLAVLGMPVVEEASTIIVRGNAALPDAELTALLAASGTSDRRIVSNGAGPSRLDPCPWVVDGSCDEIFEGCTAGTDAADCGGAVPLWGMVGSTAP
jgi:hypothetical protein